MADMLGKEVRHETFGAGVVLKSRFKGFQLQVSFRDGSNRWVRIDELEYSGESDIPTGETSRKQLGDDTFRARKMLESFRLGVVPHDCVSDFTFGREEETEQVLDWLFTSEKNTLLLVGKYGSGKSHFLHFILSKALRNRFAVAWVNLDPSDAPLHKPKQVYEKLVRNFRYTGEDGKVRGFREFIREILSRGDFRDHPYLSPLINRTSDTENLWDWIEGSDAFYRPWNPATGRWENCSLPKLYDYSTAGNIYCHLLSTFGWAARELLELDGLLLIFDEAESVDLKKHSQNAKQGRNFLRALIRTANNEPILLGEPFKTDLDHCGVGKGAEIPFLYNIPSGLKLIPAFPSLKWNYHLNLSTYQYDVLVRELEGLPEISLQPLTDYVLRQLFDHIVSLYLTAYDFTPDRNTIEMIFWKVYKQETRTRIFVKSTVEALDIIRLNDGMPVRDFLK